MSVPSRVLPVDPAFGGLDPADPGAVRHAIAATVSVPLGEGRLRYLEHDVGASMLAHHRIDVAGVPRDVVVSVGRARWGDDVPSDPSGALAAAGIAVPAADLGDLTVAWFPFDAGLPLLRRGFAELGVAGPVDRLAWVPQQRAVFATDDAVVKVDADPARVAAGVATLALLRPVVRVPDVRHVDLDIGAFVQERLRGRALGADDALDRATAAGALAAAIGGIDHADLPESTVDDLVTALDHVVRLVTHAAPELADRIATVVAVVAASRPAVGSAPAHGDFNIGQLIDDGAGGLALVDTDTLCRAPAGLDLAAYATNLLSGRTGDIDRCLRAIDGVVDGHGSAPDALPWLMAVTALRRLDRPIRRGKRRWPERVTRLLADVETLAAPLR